MFAYKHTFTVSHKLSVGSNGRRFAMNELFKLLLKTNKEWFKIDSYHSEYGHYIYDFRSTFYSTRKLLDEGTPIINIGRIINYVRI